MKTRSIVYLVFFALMIACEHILQKVSLNYGVDRFILAFVRIATGFVIIAIVFLAQKNRPVEVIKTNFRHFIVLGVGYSGIGILLKLWGISLTTATNASFIMSLSSLAVVIFAYFFLHEKGQKRFYAIMTLMTGGVYLVTTGGKQILPQTGDMIILVLAFLIGAMQAYGKKVLRTVTVIQIVFGRSLIGMLFLGLMIPVFAPNGFSTITSLPVLLVVMANGITFSSSIFLFYKALETEGASNAGMFALLAPVFTAVLGYYILGENLNLLQICGGVIILTGSLFISRQKVRQQNF